LQRTPLRTTIAWLRATTTSSIRLRPPLVFFITDAEAGAHEIVNRVDERRSDVADPSALPDVVFLPA